MPDKTVLIDEAQFYSELLRAYFDSTQDSIFVLCDEMKFLTCNKTTEHWLGYTEHELTLHNERVPITQLLGESYDANIFNKLFDQALKGEATSFETCIYPPLGEERWIEINLSRVNIENGDMVIAVARDISERKKHLATIEYQSHFDELTCLPNRSFVLEYLNEFQLNKNIESSSLVLLILDLDRFKEVNESLGYKLGDVILQEVALRLSRVADDASGEFVARLNGDEFAIVFPGTELSQSQITTQMIRQIVSQPFIIQARKISLESTIGVAALPDHTDDSNELLQFAEAAMHNAKSQKIGISVYDRELTDASSERLQLLTDFREALKKSHISTYYQPIVNMQNRSLHVETLARWNHPQRGNISPDVFIPLAEETGDIHKLTSKIMASAFRDCVALLNKKLIVNLSINISAYSLANAKFPAEIKTFLEKYNIPPASITLELTESAMMSSLPETQKTIAMLHEMGLAFSIDDFGTGYSSLSKLKRMPLKELKIDKSFITDIEQSKNDLAITNAAIQMAHGLGMDVIAEGIESEQIWNRLKQMGCDYGQGFWIAKPMPVSELLLWINNHHDLLKGTSIN
ncbi:diguanylate cyclase/phosphodiesterase (GGDEF & EAL domains) with PAS/PAC sensor(s) [hydrothermal vent metagenome]|uniref:Diguanylate cyclase/phosphodiesterase (GGDEF & EAL domains) with PAS/PAC sensor(S) n=1 Tax=hydrothermal vent metagenome TaxID=652676 RepID=A0A3B0WEG7_9ZZZZ